jgi:hypothetical protein
MSDITDFNAEWHAASNLNSETANTRSRRRILACDKWDNYVIAEGNSKDNIHSTAHRGGTIPEVFKTALSQPENYQVYVTKESLPYLDGLEAEGLNTPSLSRLLAIYWATQERLDQSPCIVISVGLGRTLGGLIVNGKLERPHLGTPSLAVAEIGKSVLKNNGLIERFGPKIEGFEAEALKSFNHAVRTGEETPIIRTGEDFPVKGMLRFTPPIDISCCLGIFMDYVGAIDRKKTASQIILSDWAAGYWSLPEFFKDKYRVIVEADKEKAFTQAARGLVIYGLDCINRQESDQKKSEPQLSRETLQENIEIEDVPATSASSTVERLGPLSESPELVEIAVLTNKIIEELRAKSAVTEEYQTRFSPYIRAAIKAKNFQEKYKQFNTDSQIFDFSSDTAQIAEGNITIALMKMELKSVQRVFEGLKKYHRAGWFIDLLEETRRVPKVSADADRLKDLLGFEDVIVNPGMNIEEFSELEVVKVEGLGRKSVINEVLANGYRSRETGIVIKKPKVKVRLEE